MLALLVALAAAAWLLSGTEPEREQSSTGATPRIAKPNEVRADRALARVRRDAARERQRQAAAEHPRGEPGPTPETLRAYGGVQRAAEPLARRFFAALARFELGESVPAELRATAMPALARELLSEPPRIPDDSRRQPPAQLGRLELVPLTAGRERLSTIELVGTIHRGRRRERIALELRLTAVGWRVAGLGL